MSAPLTPRRIAKFWSLVSSPVDRGYTSGCWEWQGDQNRNGYGRFVVNRRRLMAHRLCWELMKERACPSHLKLDHKCRNRRCVNPDHLRPVTQRTNILCGTSPAAENAAKRRCPRGHRYRVRPDGRGRRCYKCEALARREKLAA